MASPLRVLFLGNSYTYVNDLPNTFKQVANALGDSVYVDSYAQGGYNLQLLSTDAAAIAKIQLGNWDYVIIQAQSQEPSFDPSQVQAETYPYAQLLDSMVQVNNTCAETLFYMTWGRKNGDASNCAVYPPVCTYAGMQQRLRESYLEMAFNNHASTAPVGVAWKHVRDNNPSIELYQADESHPSVYGTYLAACVFYSSIFHKSAEGCNYVYTGISGADANILQTLGSSTVLDSIENWQQDGDIPLAQFSLSTNGNSISSTNNSMRYNSVLWDFGDGNTSTINNPQHTYAANGFYTVILTVTNACGKIDVKKMNVTIGNPNAIHEEELLPQNVILKGSQLMVKAKTGDSLCIMNSLGQLVFNQRLSSNQETMDVSRWLPGLYYFRIAHANDKISSGKILIGH